MVKRIVIPTPEFELAIAWARLEPTPAFQRFREVLSDPRFNDKEPYKSIKYYYEFMQYEVEKIREAMNNV